MYVANQEAIQAADAVARAAIDANNDAKALVAAAASVYETKKTADEAKHTMLEASRVAKAFMLEVQQKVIAFDINAFECSDVMCVSAAAVLCASDAAASAAAYAVCTACEYSDACEAAEAAKERLTVAVARIGLSAATAAKATTPSI